MLAAPPYIAPRFVAVRGCKYGSGSVLITAQLPVADWHGVFEDATVADATLDRLVHNAYRIELRGPSRRPGTVKSS